MDATNEEWEYDTYIIMKSKQCDYLQSAELLRELNPPREEQSKFTYYDIRGQKLYTLLSDINMKIIQLHDVVLHNVFTDIDYYQVEGVLPMWLRDAGNSQESAISKTYFEKLVNASSSYLTNKLLYYYDCEMLVNALQNRFCIIESLITQVYDVLTPNLKYLPDDYDRVMFAINEETERINAYINTIIVNMASCCDIFTKIAVELYKMPHVCYVSYPRMQSANVTFGYVKRLPQILQKEGTCFSTVRPVVINKIETIRDEIIHNGSLDFNARMYYGFKGPDFEKWILMPSMTEEGTFTSFKGRKKFYDSSTRTWNKELPILVNDFLIIASETIRILNENFAKRYYESQSDLQKYSDEIKALTEAYMKVAKNDYFRLEAERIS